MRRRGSLCSRLSQGAAHLSSARASASSSSPLAPASGATDQVERKQLASELVRRGASTTAVQAAGGWRSAAMVARYASAVAVEDGAVARLFGGAGPLNLDRAPDRLRGRRRPERSSRQAQRSFLPEQVQQQPRDLSRLQDGTAAPGSRRFAMAPAGSGARDARVRNPSPTGTGVGLRRLGSGPARAGHPAD